MSTKIEVVTSVGRLVLELYETHAPRACANFKALVARRYYDGVIFHRIVKDFIVQTGDPTGTGRGGDSAFGGPFEDELSPALKHTGAGVLSMANAGRNTNRSQWFLTLRPTPELDGKHTIFGRVFAGMGVLRALALVRIGAGDRPVDPPVIISMQEISDEEAAVPASDTPSAVAVRAS